MRCTAPANVAESDAPPAPRPTPIRIFIAVSSLQCAACGWGYRLLVDWLAAVLPAHRAGPAGDTWYRAALVRRGVEPPYRTQLDDSIYARSDCGPAVLGMALAAYGVDYDTLDLRQSDAHVPGHVAGGARRDRAAAHRARGRGLRAPDPWAVRGDDDAFHSGRVDGDRGQRCGAVDWSSRWCASACCRAMKTRACGGATTSCCMPSRATASRIRIRPCGRSKTAARAGSATISWTQPWRPSGRRARP